MPNSSRNSRQTRSKPRVDRRSLMDAIAPIKLATSGRDIPQHVTAPLVKRTVRIPIILTSAAPSHQITYAEIAQGDAYNYLSISTPRYRQIRVMSIRCYAESPNSLSVSQSPYGLILTDSATLYTIVDRAVTGSRVAAVGLQFPFIVRSIFASTSSSTTVATVTTDTAIAASTDFHVTIDVVVQFM